MRRTYMLPLIAALALTVAGCSKQPAEAEPEKPAVQTVQAINQNYPLARAGEAGWDYHKELKADLDGDGAEEALTVIARIAWDAQHQDWMYDDGHNWQVYVTEPDGKVTYLFNDWVQLGKLDVLLVENNQIVIIRRTGPGIWIYRTTYRAGDSNLEVVLQGAQTGWLQFVDPQKHD